MATKNNKIEVERIVIKFAGDSGDGMQLSGTQFSDVAAILGNDLATFPDFPSEIRAPQGTIAGVSGFQVHIGHADIHTSGDMADVLVALNPAALEYNLKHVKPGGTIVVDSDSFTAKAFKKAKLDTNRLEDGSLDGFIVIEAPVTTQCRLTLKETGLDSKTIDKTRNQFITGLLAYMFNRDIKLSEDFITNKFAKKPSIAEANIKILRAGYNFADTIEVLSTTYIVNPNENKSGKYRNITGNTATAWGLMAAAEKSGLNFFLGSYPITPATDILSELSKHKSLNIKTFQAEDEIAGINSAIGAAYAGNMAATTTSGPGLSLKSEALGLAFITELPLVIVNVMRGGPSTGLPTKTEQTDLLQSLWGRNGEAPIPVIAASSPSDCFDYAFAASKMAVEHMTPVILHTDSYLGNGSGLWKLPKMEDMPTITPIIAKPNSNYMPFERDENLVRTWAHPGVEGNEHRVGGLEKLNGKGSVSHDPKNHALMTKLRAEKVNKISDSYPKQEVYGDQEGDLLVVGWGSSYGVLFDAFTEVKEKGAKIGFTNFNYIFPLPNETADIFKKYKKILVCELNSGQFANYLSYSLPEFKYDKYNKVEAQPFMVSELKEKFNEILEAK
ncbi:MAG: 2-oxoacid:acceptor oxidoreductase subunit alpha [Bacteroidales bacterium]|nr:2-oxoacid:acceptor oxidoreductase subunit alpha [Bacteroidales bacterium]